MANFYDNAQDEALALASGLNALSDTLNELSAQELAVAADAFSRGEFGASINHSGRAQGLSEASSEISRHLSRWIEARKVR